MRSDFSLASNLYSCNDRLWNQPYLIVDSVGIKVWAYIGCDGESCGTFPRGGETHYSSLSMEGYLGGFIHV